jgi:hypothetical protein
MRHQLVGAGLHLDAAVRLVVQDEVREDVVNDFIWSLADEVKRWVDSAVECIRQAVFVKRIIISTWDIFNVVGVLKCLGQLSLFVSGVVTRLRRSFGGLVLF